MHRLLSPFLVVVGIACYLLPVGAAAAQGSTGAGPRTAGEAVQRSISVEGKGEVEAVPDIAEISTGVAARAATARESLDSSNAAMARLMATLRAAAIADGDIRTSDFAVSPVYERPDRNAPRRIAAYEATNQVTVTLRDLNRIGAILDSLVTAGSNRVRGIRFRVAKPDALLDRARGIAFADARRRATIYAEAAGATLGKVLRISERIGHPPTPRMFAAEAVTAARGVPVAPGRQELSVTVVVQFALE